MKDYRHLFGNLVKGEFPNIKAVNASGPNNKDGTPYTADVLDDIWGWMQALMAKADIKPNGESESADTSQLLEALKILFAAGGIDLPKASLHEVGITQLSNAIDSNADDISATSKAVNTLRIELLDKMDILSPPPPRSVPLNLALHWLGREVTGSADVTEIINIMSGRIARGWMHDIVVGDWFGLSSIDIPNGPSGQGAFSATLADVPGGFGRNLDMVVVAVNPYLGRNGNTQPHVIIQPRHVLSTITVAGQLTAGGHRMNSLNTNVGGYLASEGRTFVITQVRNALIASGIPLDDTSICISLNRRVSSNVIIDNLFLLTEFEINGNHIHSSPADEPEATRAYFAKFYPDNASRIKRRSDGLAVRWWLASPATGNSAFCAPTDIGSATTANASQWTYAISPAFAVGGGGATGLMANEVLKQSILMDTILGVK